MINDRGYLSWFKNLINGFRQTPIHNEAVAEAGNQRNNNNPDMSQGEPS